jgi:hypothetical protein
MTFDPLWTHIKPLCYVAGCENTDYSAGGLCSRHYKLRWRAMRRTVNLSDDGSGIVYLATSPWIPGLVKIGATRGESPEHRLSSSSIPGVRVHCFWRESPPWALEVRLHWELAGFRATGEWFSVEPEYVVGVVDRLRR